MTTLQDVFNKTVNHMRAQGNSKGDFKSRGWAFVNPKNPCERCAKGIHMDVVYCPYTEKYTIDNFSLQKFDQFVIQTRSYALLKDLENLFEFHPQNTWEQRFKEIAFRYKLKLSPILPKNKVLTDNTSNFISNTETTNEKV